MDNCDKSPDGKHSPVWYSGSYTSRTLMGGCGNIITKTVRCEWCGIYGKEKYKEQIRQIKGRGPFAQECVEVLTETNWNQDG